MTRFYKEWLQPQGFVDTVGIILEKSWTSCAAFAVLRNAQHGIVDQPTRRRMALLAPHLQRAVLIGKTIELKNMANENFAMTLDALSTAVYLLSDTRAILHANRSATVLRDTDTILTASGSEFEARNPEINGQLRAIFSAAAAPDAAVPGKAKTVDITAPDGERFMAHVLPLRSGTRSQVSRYHGATFAVFIHQAALWRPTLVESVVERFQLTPAEVRVLFAVLEVGSVPNIAPVLGISEATVKTHLKHIFRKTGANRQADLVKLVAEFASPPIL